MENNSPDFVKLWTGDVVWRQVGDEVMMLDTNTSQYLAVNKSGSTLWPLLLEGCHRSQLAEALVAQFDLDEAQAIADADEFLASLRQLGLIDEGAAPA